MERSGNRLKNEQERSWNTKQIFFDFDSRYKHRKTWPKQNKIKKKEGQRFCSSKLHGAKNNLHNSIKECDMIENAWRKIIVATGLKPSSSYHTGNMITGRTAMKWKIIYIAS